MTLEQKKQVALESFRAINVVNPAALEHLG